MSKNDERSTSLINPRQTAQLSEELSSFMERIGKEMKIGGVRELVWELLTLSFLHPSNGSEEIDENKDWMDSKLRKGRDLAQFFLKTENE